MVYKLNTLFAQPMGTSHSRKAPTIQPRINYSFLNKITPIEQSFSFSYIQIFQNDQ